MIDYKGFIEHYFTIIDETGRRVPFVFNEVQDKYYKMLQDEYGDELKGVRENIDKARREGFSSFIEAIFMADFILSSIGKINTTSGQVISHKVEEATPHIRRSNLYLDSYLEIRKLTRKDFLKTDNTKYIESHTLSEYFVGTAGAKTVGRGGTLQNLHWTEVAFYPNTDILNAENIVMPAEQQVADDIGKIFRESTGNTLVDYFATEYFAGKKPGAIFKSRFFGWFEFSKYRRRVPEGYVFSEEHQLFMDKYDLDPEQMYWYIGKVLNQQGVDDKTGESKLKKAKREYPTEDRESFLVSGEMYFNSEAIDSYDKQVLKPITHDLIYV